MNLKEITNLSVFKPALGAALTVLCGLALWTMPLGERWVNASYDYLFAFGARPVTNKIVLILMDKEAYHRLGQERKKPWDRGKHAELINRLANGGCPLVVLDAFLRGPSDPLKDEELAKALRRLPNVVLMAEHSGVTLQHADAVTPNLASVTPHLPTEPFLSAAGTNNWGVAFFDPDLDLIVRRHWPFPAPPESGQFLSLPWVAALKAGAKLDATPGQQWLRYYGEQGPWTSLSYHQALMEGTNEFRDKVVFIGNKPETTVPDREVDQFRTPYTQWSGVAVGGVELNATAFLNLVNGDWLRRPSGWIEGLLLDLMGLLLGWGFTRARPLAAFGLALGAALAMTFGAVALSYFTNYWFPWLVIVGGQVPCALACSVVASQARRNPQPVAETIVVSELAQAGRVAELPDAPDYELFTPPFGQGAYGKVWLARNAIGQWQALKAVYLARFGPHPEPYEREFNGIKRYKPISDKHPGLLRVDFVSTRKEAGYFYYVMELGDAVEPGWEQAPASYKPLDLASMRARSPDSRLPLEECIRIALALAEALDFLHRQGLTHRDIKPQNIIFVNGRPKLADVGLTTELLPTSAERTWVGTPGYMPPPPEPPGTQQADIYGLGMVLYVIRTGREPDLFPAVSTTLVEGAGQLEFIRLNAVILKACQPDRAQRFSSAAQMHAALLEVERALHLERETSKG